MEKFGIPKKDKDVEGLEQLKTFDDFKKKETGMLSKFGQSKFKNLFISMTVGVALFATTSARAFNQTKDTSTSSEYSEKEYSKEIIEKERALANAFLEKIYNYQPDSSLKEADLIQNIRQEFRIFCADLYKISHPEASEELSVGIKEKYDGAQALSAEILNFADQKTDQDGELGQEDINKIMDYNYNIRIAIALINNFQHVPPEYRK